jgi:hypothetical protein
MALGAVLSKIFDPSETGDHERRANLSARVPEFANADIYFFVKRIDNRRVVLADDPGAGETCWKMIGSVVAAVVLLVGVLLPSAYGLLAGYQIQSLRREGQRLATEQASLELREAALVSPQRMQDLARIQLFIDPAPNNVVYLQGKGSLASNRK